MERDEALEVSESSRDRKTRLATTYEDIQVRSPISFGHDGRKRALSDASADEPRFNLDNYRAWVRRQRKKARDNTWLRLENGFNAWYQKWIIERLLRQCPLPPSKDGRHIPLTFGHVRKTALKDERTGGTKPFISNFIRSSRYTIWSFLPKQLYFQFSKLANFYFLIIAILQAIPGLSTTGTYTTIATLIPFIAISMAKEGYDDYRRYQLDKKENRSQVSVLDPEKTVSYRRARKWRQGKVDAEMAAAEMDDLASQSDVWSRIQWQHLRVGDIIRLHRDESIPADIVLLHASGPDGVAYIETMALDGETNLKSKQACPLLAKRCDTISKLKEPNAHIVSEDPNLDLYNYEGRVTVDDETMPLTLNEVVYRGSIMRNTTHATGLVINTGEECKIRMNANKEIRAKMPVMQRKINHIVLFLVAFVAFLSVGLTTANEIWKHKYQAKAWQLKNAWVPVKQILIGYIIMFNTLIPLSLIVSLEIIKLGQLFLLQDVEMYDEETNTPMVANTTTILENLGQVSYVFSDKTGTLTENKMRFRKLSVAGTAWIHDMDIRRDLEEKEKRLQNMKGKGKMPAAPRAAEAIASETGEPRAPLIHHGRDVRTRQSSITWAPSGRASHPQPELNTERLLGYIYQKPHTPFSRKAKQFLLCVALCHTCLPETKPDGTVEFQAASPDELALVRAAQDLGYLLVDRPTQSVVLRVKNSEGELPSTETYEVLNVIEFSSKRKRMSIVIRMPDGRICVFCKGADSMILPRLKLAHLALQKASDINRRATLRKSVEAARALQRKSMHTQRSIDIVRAASTKRHSFRGVNPPKQSSIVSDEVATWLDQRENEDVDGQSYGGGYHSPVATSPTSMSPPDALGTVVDEFLASDDASIFERCFQHIDNFASEGLRTLIYAYRYIDEGEYASWRQTYQAATTSLDDRQKRIEEAAELIEQDFDLAGATAIEDKLQNGVPETIDKLRRANIKVWMLTGDKRETAINIAHSARICKPFSEVFILDATKGDLQETMVSTLVEVGRGMIAHSVVVVDGHTLGVVDEDETLKAMFLDLGVRADSVICCRASPSQKASLVKSIRSSVPSSLTLAIGDGANDIAMIQASHVGIGISGREGLQAARTADFSIAQFRFLQRLLFVHGRWNYLRTGKYVLATFWKEMLFYVAQCQYQRWDGYTGTSLFESTSLAVFNTLFTSLCVILPGIFEKDLDATTLLAVPELYTYGQRSEAFNYKKYLAWNIMAVAESVLIYMMVHALYGMYSGDLFSFGQLIFTIIVVFINTKLFLLEMHHKTVVTLVGWLLTVGGWFLWNMFVTGSGVIKHSISPYPIQDSFFHGFGRQLLWWIVCALALAAAIIFELCVTSLRRVFFPKDQDLWQEIERLGAGKVLEEHAATSGMDRGEFQPEHPPTTTVAGDDSGSDNAGLDRILSGVSVDLPHRQV